MPSPISTFAQVGQSFSWDDNVLRYRAPDGRFVADREVKRAINTVVERSAAEVRSISQQLAEGSMSLDVWQTQMAGALKNLHLASAAAGVGGFNQMDATEYGRVGARLRFQYDRLDRFATQIEAGQLTADGIVMRAEMYARSGSLSFEEGKRNAAKAALMTEERRVLGAAEHCPDCVDAAELGWQPIGSLPRIGDSRCLTNCKCTFEFRRGPDDEDVVEDDGE